MLDIPSNNGVVKGSDHDVDVDFVAMIKSFVSKVSNGLRVPRLAYNLTNVGLIQVFLVSLVGHENDKKLCVMKRTTTML